ncbi:MAG: hypothetical protein ACFFC7_28725 [Candidatus Hermodarchaeota archaeon]
MASSHQTQKKARDPNYFIQFLIKKLGELSERYFQLYVFTAFVVLELSLAIFLDTTFDFDAITRASIGLNYYAGEIGLDFIQWLPFFGAGGVWLPLFQWLIGLTIVFPLQLTDIHVSIAVFIGETFSAFATAGTALYVYKILRNFFDLDRVQSSLSFVFFLAHGLWLAYGSQSMTDVLSVFLLIATIYHMTIFLTRETYPTQHLVLASILAALNNFLRYEPWALIFLTSISFISFNFWKMIQKRQIDWWRLEQSFRMINFLVLPSLVCVVWLLHTFRVTGSFFEPAEWILANNNWGFVPFTQYNPLLSLGEFFFVMTVATIFWVMLPIFAFWIMRNINWLNKQKPEAVRFLFLQWIILGSFTITTYYLIFLGINTGWPRHFFYIIPFVVIACTVLYSVGSVKMQKRLRSTLYIGLLLSVGTILVLHVIHLLFVGMYPEFIVL